LDPITQFPSRPKDFHARFETGHGSGPGITIRGSMNWVNYIWSLTAGICLIEAIQEAVQQTRISSNCRP
jgi:isocitrate/isopropylmalate dehydrogenase